MHFIGSSTLPNRLTYFRILWTWMRKVSGNYTGNHVIKTMLESGLEFHNSIIASHLLKCSCALKKATGYKWWTLTPSISLTIFPSNTPPPPKKKTNNSNFSLFSPCSNFSNYKNRFTMPNYEGTQNLWYRYVLCFWFALSFDKPRIDAVFCLDLLNATFCYVLFHCHIKHVVKMTGH